MANFDQLNKQTRDYKNNCCTPPTHSTPTMKGTQRIYNEQWQNLYNNQTYKQNNGEFSKKFY